MVVEFRFPRNINPGELEELFSALMERDMERVLIQLPEGMTRNTEILGDAIFSIIKFTMESAVAPASIVAICGVIKTYIREETKRLDIRLKAQRSNGEHIDTASYSDDTEKMKKKAEKWVKRSNE